MSELVEGPRVLGLGLGLFLLVLLWSGVLAIVLLCTRLSLGGGVLLTALAGGITAVMVAIPRSPPVFKDHHSRGDESDFDIDDYKIYDYILIWKIILMVIMSSFVVGGALCFFCGHGKEGVYPQTIRRTAIKS